MLGWDVNGGGKGNMRDAFVTGLFVNAFFEVVCGCGRVLSSTIGIVKGQISQYNIR